MRRLTSGTRLFWLMLALGLVLAVRQWVWMPMLVVGNSMEPALRPGQLAAVNKLVYLVHPPRRGDMVVVRTNQGLMVKRIVGLPGEEIAMRNGVFYVNRKLLAEPYVLSRSNDTVSPGRLGRHHFMVAGDCRTVSTMAAVVSQHRIVGRLAFQRQPGKEKGGLVFTNL